MTTTPDPTEQMNNLLDELIKRADLLDKRLLEDKRERTRENALRDKRIRWSRIAIVAALLVGVFALIVGYQARSTGEQIQSTRKSSVAAICSGFEGFTNSLISSQHATDPVQIQERNAQIAAFETDLEQRLGPLNCHFHLIPAG